MITFEDLRIRTVLGYIKSYFELSAIQENVLIERLWTFSSKVRQPRKDDRSCNKTPYFDRWDVNSRTSYLSDTDPRYASKEECEQIFLKLITLLLETEGAAFNKKEEFDDILVSSVLGRSLKKNSLKCIITKESITKEDITKSLKYATQRLGSFEIPTGYLKELNEGGRHNHENVGWIKPFHINYQLRLVLRNEIMTAGGSSKSAKNALDKIQVKAYCTDKFTMPPFFSNRDIRWATWPKSFQYSSHYVSCMIELELMRQIFEFGGAPRLDEALKKEIEQKRGKPVIENSRRCYITGKELCFSSYLDGAISPKGGVSAYHVSHIMPLTRGGKHHQTNVEWISGDGNRIQGNDTVNEIEEKLVDAVSYYAVRTTDFPASIKPKLKNLLEILVAKIRK